MPLGKPLLQALQRTGYGGLILDTTGCVLLANQNAEALLKSVAIDRPTEGTDWIRNALKALLLSTGSERLILNQETWIVLHREPKRPLILHAVPLGVAALSGPHTILVLIDLEST